MLFMMRTLRLMTMKETCDTDDDNQQVYYGADEDDYDDGNNE